MKFISTISDTEFINELYEKANEPDLSKYLDDYKVDTIFRVTELPSELDLELLFKTDDGYEVYKDKNSKDIYIKE